MTTPMPGDYGCVPVRGPGGFLIQLGEAVCLARLPWRRRDAADAYQHAFVLVSDGWVMQAEPDGASLAPVPSGDVLWSSGRIALTDGQRHAIVAAATMLRGTPYSWLDYLAIAAHRFRLPVPWLRRYISSSRHLICSQLVDQCYADAGVHLFTDGRWPGFVTPADLAALLEGSEPSPAIPTTKEA